MRLIGKVEAVMAKSMSQDTEDKSVVGQSGDESKTTVGSILRSARQARGGKPISEIAEDIRVRPHQLQALEDDDYDKLPGMIYATGFIRAYAKYLDLDGEELVDRFRRTARTEDLEARLAFPEPMEDPRIPRRSLVAVACTLALAIYGTWYGLSGTGDAAFEEVPTVDSRLAGVLEAGVLEDAVGDTDSPSLDGEAQSAPAGAASKASQISGVTVDQPVRTAAVDPGAVDPSAGADEIRAVVPDPLKRPDVAQNEIVEQATDVAAMEDVARPQVVASMDATFESEQLQSSPLLRKASTVSGQVAVRAREDAWVRIEGPDSKPVIDTVLRAGEVYQAPAGAEFTMMTGNAGAIDILIDGKSMGALGPRGEIRRHVALDPSVLGRTPAVRQQ